MSVTVVVVVVLAVLSGVNGRPDVELGPGADPADVPTHPNSVPEAAEEGTEAFGQPEGVTTPEPEIMQTGELNPAHYPAQRAAKVVQHYLNTRHGSPYKVFGLHAVHSAKAEDVAESGSRKYQLEISVQDHVSNTTAKCSAEVVFSRVEGRPSPPQVGASCEESLQIDTRAQEEALFRKYAAAETLLSSQQHLPDSYGHMEPDMRPFWHLGAVASSFVMLGQSTEATLYNMAQVANFTQLATENNQLKFDYHVLLHDMVSQEILHWKVLFTWSPAEGVKVLHTEQLPHCCGSDSAPKTP